jgi:hypothetical protein
MADSSLEAKVSGTINIGSVAIPISTPLPPKTTGEFVFDYEAADPKNPTASGSIGDLLTWIKQFGLDIPVSDLPSSLQTLAFGLVTLKFNTSFTLFDVVVLMGTEKDKTFTATWTPIPSFSSFSLSGVTFEVDLPTKQ